MRRSSEVNRVLLASLLGSLWMPLALQSEEPAAFRQYAVERANARPSAKPASSFDLEFNLALPKAAEPQPMEQPSSRRRWASGITFSSEGEMPPGFFVPDDDRPIKPLAGEFPGNPIRAADYIETLGYYPGTPMAPHPRNRNVLINDLQVVPVSAEDPLDDEPRSGKVKSSDSSHEVEHGEAAKVILELMETLGRSVLDGTVFQKPNQDEQQWLKDLSADGEVSPREALIKYIRHLEAVEAKARQKTVVCEEETECLISFGAGHCECECLQKCLGCKSACATKVAACSSKCSSPCECHDECDCSSPCGKCAACPVAQKCADCPVACQKCGGCTVKVLACSDSAELAPDIDPGAVEVLRDMASHLDMASNELERREMYSRADQLRDLAGNLRQDARKVSVAKTSHKGPCICLPQPPVDVHTQLRQLHEELLRTRAELEQARGQFYPPHPTNR